MQGLKRRRSAVPRLPPVCQHCLSSSRARRRRHHRPRPAAAQRAALGHLSPLGSARRRTARARPAPVVSSQRRRRRPRPWHPDEATTSRRRPHELDKNGLKDGPARRGRPYRSAHGVVDEEAVNLNPAGGGRESDRDAGRPPRPRPRPRPRPFVQSWISGREGRRLDPGDRSREGRGRRRRDLGERRQRRQSRRCGRLVVPARGGPPDARSGRRVIPPPLGPRPCLALVPRPRRPHVSVQTPTVSLAPQLS